MTILYFDNEEKAIIALLQINSNMGLPINWDEVKQLPLDAQHYFCSSWNNLTQAHKQDIWYFTKPDEEFMQQVIEFKEIESIPDEWLSKEE